MQLGVRVDFCVKMASVLVALAEGVGVGVSISVAAEVNAVSVLVALGEGVSEGEGVGVLRSWIDKPGSLPRRLLRISSPAMIQLAAMTIPMIISNGNHNCLVLFAWDFIK